MFHYIHGYIWHKDKWIWKLLRHFFGDSTTNNWTNILESLRPILSQIKSLDCGPQHKSSIMRAQAMLNTAVIDIARSCWESGISDLSLRACRPNCTEYKKHERGQESDYDKWRRFQGVCWHSLWCTPLCPGWPLLYALWMKICILMAEFKWRNNFLKDWALPYPPCWSVVTTYSGILITR